MTQNGQIQEKTQWTREQEKRNEIAGAMGVLLQNTPPATDSSKRFLRSISMPRDMEYIRIIARQIELLNQKQELLEELELLGQEKPEEETGEKFPANGIWAYRTQKRNIEMRREKAEETQKETSAAQLRKKQIEEELRRMEEEAAFLRSNLEAMFPESRRMQCMIYPSNREMQLICAGVISGMGTPYQGGEELCARVKPMTAQERHQLLLGNRLLEEQMEEVLNIEIYPEAVCVVYPDGSTKIYR